ncbi:NAD-binding protein [Stieleria varia]|uniref:Dihydrolipoamide dehydrogenase n=1 Tax=Stieleria varia TaxID=2528005 RepID=A0A5C6B1G1_9BACT|nr:NAD-binding protein [Stieleria varia]TWU05718.1 dihydrolipoamide dehydrogenase [Stieleria varia]
MNHPFVLEPPGSIAVIGAGPLGIEAALYGRYLGYDVTVIEAHRVGYSMYQRREEPLPMMPDRCLTPLAISALNAQRGDNAPMTLPVTIGQWINNALLPLTQSDLLSDRVREGCVVTAMDWVPVPEQPSNETNEETGEEDDDEEPPPDFRLTFKRDDGTTETLDVEAVIVATGESDEISRSFSLPAVFHFELGRSGAPSAKVDPERDLHVGWKEIVQIYSQLADREQLDLYRPLRG